MDTLSDILSLLRPLDYMSAGLDAGGRWSVGFPGPPHTIKCGAVVSGRCWLSVDGVPEAARLEPGHCFLLPGGRPFRLASDPVLPPVAAGNVFASARRGGVVTWNGGGDVLLVSSRFALAQDQAPVLLGLLPPLVHIRAPLSGDPLRRSVEQMMAELREPQPGGALVLRHLAHMMLVQALRLSLNEEPEGAAGWLAGLADKRLRGAINAVHEDPARRWTLRDLAGEAGMSRSAFALAFRSAVGTAPMEYLTRWRMRLAADRLARTQDPVSGIALSLGYESESAFGTAFKRVMGVSPRQYGRGRLPVLPGDGAPLDPLQKSPLLSERA
ncbi:AraC family transcriptional regulator [Microvirga pudoricolor]|uniref:AraC family transcriptional regulator n=1 Tax=Microvirga pudoricolor TaxID=2778729 RepID=UPI001952874B|nr:AraC family transcriptional regulator [Microvirga pudoricolor]MBM6593946.1 AraC family transcriptional regulator [Microvirga pudoricolor]